MRKLAFVLAIGVGAWYWHHGELPFLSPAGAFDEAGNPEVWVFTIAGCGKPCQQARSQLKGRRVSFEEKLIDPNNDNDENVKLWKKVGRNGFPLIVAGKERLIGAGSRPKMATLLALNFGDKYLTRTEKRYFEQHFYADGSPKIVMYGADWCQYCKKLRTELEADKVDYVEIDVEKSGEKERMSKTMEIYGYPATWVGYTRVNGTTLKAVKTALNNY
ncbi:MAG: hypothetical protein GY935_17235 [Gammaproteobacteria bacterium]|nr:hypothetical protein [Gammaproteobacteria bacterium]